MDVSYFGPFYSGGSTHMFFSMFSSFAGNSFVKFGTLLNVSFVSPGAHIQYMYVYQYVHVAS